MQVSCPLLCETETASAAISQRCVPSAFLNFGMAAPIFEKEAIIYHHEGESPRGRSKKRPNVIPAAALGIRQTVRI